MPSDYTPNAPIYLQISQDIRQRIVSGQWPPGMRIPPVRELSVELGVNPNTAQRALTDLEREGLVFVERTSGRFITGDTVLIRQIQNRMAHDFTGQYYTQMRALGYDSETMMLLLRQLAAAKEGTL